jgi:hypothetical protein
MNRMSLKFLSTHSRAELFESEFSSPLVGRLLRCVRGRQSFTETVEGTFQWTSGVQSLSAVVIKAKLAELARTSRQAWPQTAGLCSDDTSWALSLDFALSKKPRWLLDMFGVDQTGTPILKRLFLRMNPEKKRPGPAWVSLNPAFLEPQNITIVLDGIELKTSLELTNLLKRVGFESKTPQADRDLAGVVESSPETMYDTTQRLIQGWIERELLESIFGSDVFTLIAQRVLKERIQTDEPVKFLFGAERRSLSEFFDQKTSLETPPTHIAKELTSSLGPVRLFTTIAQVGAISLFKVLEKRLGMQLDIILDSPHTPAIVSRAKETSESPKCLELFSLAIGACGSSVPLLRSLSIVPITLLPGVSYELMGKEQFGMTGSLKGDLFVFQEAKSTSSIYLRHLYREGLAGTQTLNLIRTEPAEVLAAMRLKGNKSGAILWFPHNRVSELVAGAKSSLKMREKFGMSESFLLGRLNELGSLEPIRQLVRYAWLQLRIDPQLRREVVHEISATPAYSAAFLRHTGMHSYLNELPDLVQSRSQAANS